MPATLATTPSLMVVLPSVVDTGSAVAAVAGVAGVGVVAMMISLV
jgi:hypothetical protein